jgi:tetratricopeptide (TPR) repeat protein
VAGPRQWGKLARKGAGRMHDEGGGGASQAWRAAMDERRAAEVADQGPPPRRRELQPEDWVRVDDIEDEATHAVERGRRAGGEPTGRGVRRPIEPEDTDEADGDGSARDELLKAVGPTRVARYEQRLKDASRAFDAERFGDAARILRKLAEDAPGSATVRELNGLTLYRLGRWRPAIRELEAFRSIAGSTEQHPVLADCYRAVNQHDMVAELWEELRAASPGAALVTEGRIVYAGSQADRGDVPGAVQTLEQGFTMPKRPLVHHLRRAYALADAYERAGDVVRARELFGRVAVHDRRFADAAQRARALN